MNYKQFTIRCGNSLNLIHWVLATLPLFWLSSVYLYAIKARFVLRYWPYPYNPDPKTKVLQDAIGGYYAATWYIGEATLIAAVLVMILIPILKFLRPQMKLLPRVIYFIAIWLFTFFWIRFDPGKFIEWYFD